MTRIFHDLQSRKTRFGMTQNELHLCRGKWGQYGDKGRVKIREGDPV